MASVASQSPEGGLGLGNPKGPGTKKDGALKVRVPRRTGGEGGERERKGKGGLF